MSKLQHTPGPWKVIFSEKWPFRISIENEEGIEIVCYDRCAHSTAQETIEDCESAVGFKNFEKDEVVNKIKEQKANILLHAAAPEMLEALIFILKDARIENDEYNITNIIKKATGLNIEEVLKCTE